MTNELTPEVDYSAFEAEVDRVIEAAANRDAERGKADAQFLAYCEALNVEEDELREQLDVISSKRTHAGRIHSARVAKINEVFGAEVDDSEPF